MTRILLFSCVTALALSRSFAGVIAPGTYTYFTTGGTTVNEMEDGVKVVVSHYVEDFAVLNQNGGSNQFLYGWGDSTINQSGGSNEYLVGYDDSTINLVGGLVGELIALDRATINIWARDFTGSDFMPDLLSGFASFSLDDLSDHNSVYKASTLALEYDDGSTDSFSFLGRSYASNPSLGWTGTLNLYDTDFFAAGTFPFVSVIPEPSSILGALTSFVVVSLLVRRRRRCA